MALTYIGLDCEIGYVPSGTSLLYDNIIKLGDYKYPVYTGKLDLSSYPKYGTGNYLAVIYGTNNNNVFSNNISNFLSNFSVAPYSDLCVFLSSKNSTLFNQTYSLAQQLFQYISINDAYSTYTVHFKNDTVYYAVSDKVFYIKNVTDNTTVFSDSYNDTDDLWQWLIDVYISSATKNDRFVLHCITLDTDFSFKFYEINVNSWGTANNDKRIYTHINGVPIEYNSILQNTLLSYYGGGLISNCQVILNKYQFPYTGSAIIPTIKVYDTIKDITLLEGVQYSASIINNIDIGTATVTVTGINNYNGTKYQTFVIYAGDDPFSPGGSTDTDGGDGDFDDSSDTVPAPSLPSISALGSKITTIWVPTQSELQSFAEWFFSTNLLDIQTYIRTFANPIEFILGLSIVPLNVSYTTNEVVIGLVSSGVSMRRALTQFITFDCGTVNINEYWGAYLDYSPYTKIDLFLPFIGFRQLDADVVMGHTVNIKYNCDILSGACVAFVLVDGTVAYTFSGNMATQIPISGIDLTSIIATAATVATVGIGAVAAGVGAASGVSGSFLPMTDKIATVGKAIGSNLAEGASAVASKVIGTKQNIEKSGSISGSAGILSNKTPYLVINRPRQAVPDSQSHFTGYPGFINYKLQALSGYTVVEHIHLDNAPCTDDEAAELLTILKGGFVI